MPACCARPAGSWSASPPGKRGVSAGTSGRLPETRAGLLEHLLRVPTRIVVAHAGALGRRQQPGGARVLAGAGGADSLGEAPAEIRVRRRVHSGDDHEQTERGGQRLLPGAEQEEIGGDAGPRGHEGGGAQRQGGDGADHQVVGIQTPAELGGGSGPRHGPTLSERPPSGQARTTVAETVRDRLRALQGGVSGRTVKQWLEAGRVRVNGAVVRRGDTPVVKADRVELGAPLPPPFPAPLRLVHADAHLVVVDKPPGLLTIADAGERQHTAYRLLRDWVEATGGRRIL